MIAESPSVTVLKGDWCCADDSEVTDAVLSCTVLHEQDESVKGILTILCNHSFHVACLAEWKDTRYALFCD